MRSNVCKLCRRCLDRNIHGSIRYHPGCKQIVRRKQKLACWHRNKEQYRYTVVKETV